MFLLTLTITLTQLPAVLRLLLFFFFIFSYHSPNKVEENGDFLKRKLNTWNVKINKNGHLGDLLYTLMMMMFSLSSLLLLLLLLLQCRHCTKLSSNVACHWSMHNIWTVCYSKGNKRIVTNKMMQILLKLSSYTATKCLSIKCKYKLNIYWYFYCMSLRISLKFQPR